MQSTLKEFIVMEVVLSLYFIDFFFFRGLCSHWLDLLPGDYCCCFFAVFNCQHTLLNEPQIISIYYWKTFWTAKCSPQEKNWLTNGMNSLDNEGLLSHKKKTCRLLKNRIWQRIQAKLLFWNPLFPWSAYSTKYFKRIAAALLLGFWYFVVLY